MTSAEPGRPVTATVLLGLLGLQGATAICLAALSLISALALWLNRSRGEFADLAALVSALLAAVALLAAALAVLGWLALRRRGRVAVPLTLALHALPLLVVLGLTPVRGIVAPALLAALLWAALGAGLALAAATRTWLR
jgi:hypothetical protein